MPVTPTTPSRAVPPSAWLRTTVAISTLLSGCTDRAAPLAELPLPAVSVRVATVAEGMVATPVTATGTFGSRDEIPLAFKIGGVVARVLVDEGAVVRRGQLLATLDMREINAMVDKAQVGYAKATRDLARVQRLATDSVATLAQLQDATSAMEAARADLTSARVNQEYAQITAPEGGIIMRRHVSAGSNVSPGTPMFLLGGSTRGRVLRMGVPDRDALRIRLGDPTVVQFDAQPGRSYAGTVVLVGRSADPRTGTYAVEVTLRGADALPSGLVGRAEIAVRGSTAGAALPVDAMVEVDRDSATIFTLPPTGEPIAQRQRVRVGAITGDRVQVDGLSPETRVITHGAAYVTAGAPVRVITNELLNAASKARGIVP